MGYLPRADVLEVYRQSDVLFAQLNDTPTLEHHRSSIQAPRVHGNG